MSTQQLSLNGANILEQREFEWFTTTEFGMEFKPGTPRENWLETVQDLCGKFEGSEKVHLRIMFMLGDALHYGENSFGEEFAEAIDGTRKRLGLSMKTICNAANICANVPAENRNFILTLSHYDAVQSLDAEKQREILRIAENEGQSVSAVKNSVAHAKLTKADKALIRKELPDGKNFEDLTASEIKRLLKRASSGDPPTEKVTINLASEPELQLAAEKIAAYFQKCKDEDPKLSFKSWSKQRRAGWSSLGALAKVARSMGHAR